MKALRFNDRGSWALISLTFGGPRGTILSTMPNAPMVLLASGKGVQKKIRL